MFFLKGSLLSHKGGAQDVDEPSACAEEGGLGLVSGSGYHVPVRVRCWGSGGFGGGLEVRMGGGRGSGCQA